MKTKINKDKAVELILDEIEKGLTFNDCMAVILSKVQLNERTFADYWKEAQETYRERRKAIEKAKQRLDANVNFDLVLELLLLTIKEN